MGCGNEEKVEFLWPKIDKVTDPYDTGTGM